jgi:steroid delta-isomerase-like uncharacterized protein
MTESARGRTVVEAVGHLALLVVLTALTSCGEPAPPSSEMGLDAFATRYAEAWSSQDPARLASFYGEDGVLVVNDGTPSEGREAVRATAEAFMTAFPDMRVVLDSLVVNGNRAVFHWTWTGTNTGPGGTGRAVDISGYEEWTLGPDGLIAESLGHYDEAEYQRQVSGSEGGDR